MKLSAWRAAAQSYSAGRAGSRETAPADRSAHPYYPNLQRYIGRNCPIATTVATLGLDQVYLLPYHSLGQLKYGLLGRECSFPSTPPMVKARLEEVKATAEGAGLTAKVGG